MSEWQDLLRVMVAGMSREDRSRECLTIGTPSTGGEIIVELDFDAPEEERRAKIVRAVNDAAFAADLRRQLILEATPRPKKGES